MALAWISTRPLAWMTPSNRPAIITEFPVISPSTRACSPRMSVPSQARVPFMCESIRRVPGDSSFPSSRTPFSRKPLHSPESCCLRSNIRQGTVYSYICSLYSSQLVVETSQITIVVVFEDDLARAAGACGNNKYASSVFALKFVDGSLRVRIKLYRHRHRARFGATRGQTFDLPDRHSRARDLSSQRNALVGLSDGKQRTRVARGDSTFLEKLLDAFFELQEPHGIG